MDIDRYLRNNLDDADYAEALKELEVPYIRIRQLETELNSARSEVEALRVNDARYRYLREASISDEEDLINRLVAANSEPKTEAEFDAAIDQARGK